MIETRDLVPGPPPPKETVEEPPRLTDEQAMTAFRSKIEAIRKMVELRLRLGYIGESMMHPRLGQSRELLVLSAESEDSGIVHELGPGGVVKFWGILERGRAQELLFQVMEEYGLNPNHMDRSLKSPWGSNNMVSEENGTRTEFIAFPSTTIPGLVFHRERNFYPETNGNIRVSWHVSDRAPAFNIHLR